MDRSFSMGYPRQEMILATAGEPIWSRDDKTVFCRIKCLCHSSCLLFFLVLLKHNTHLIWIKRSALKNLPTSRQMNITTRCSWHVRHLIEHVDFIVTYLIAGCQEAGSARARLDCRASGGMAVMGCPLMRIACTYHTYMLTHPFSLSK